MPKDKIAHVRKIVSGKTLIITLVVIAIFSSIGVYLYQAQAQFPVHGLSVAVKGNVSSSIIYAAETGTEQGISPLESAPMLEVHIANNGLTLLRGARVHSISDNTIYVITEWSSTEFTWEVQTKLFTKFLGTKGEKKTLADIHVGDIVTITGKLIRGGADPIIDAGFVRE